MTDNTKRIAEQIEEARRSFDGRPPIHQWHPELSGEIDIVIKRSGQWVYQGRPIERQGLVKLFASILRREHDGAYYLVTPVEKWRLQVEDTALLAHSVSATGNDRDQTLTLTLNTGETLVVGPDHPLSVSHYPNSDEPRPVVRVTHGVDARLVTNAFYDLAGLAVEEDRDGLTRLGVWSDRMFFPLDDDPV
ncbi:hypothetical protein C8D92_102113 [Tamilnaduibacter salinus]|uniref:DUF1285 domain-containing protein n=1 Tax=Tamilnaduibacter salinus TaxID=1484056 RepID=A0A2A2HZV1_9GAMM|nr:DUF1285 domain-containing protein [Tamilnaduibacter salinus]PAV24917.1 hypothetical protein CF392_13675 [Tamilnaduibacter salinus]PVY78078.1 hypothetical protein C8D92_102113 [Tamilnaduibacter salinus]